MFGLEYREEDFLFMVPLIMGINRIYKINQNFNSMVVQKSENTGKSTLKYQQQFGRGIYIQQHQYVQRCCVDSTCVHILYSSSSAYEPVRNGEFKKLHVGHDLATSASSVLSPLCCCCSSACVTVPSRVDVHLLTIPLLR